MFETHVVNENRNSFKMYFDDYKLAWIDARKVHKYGRASGGCLYGYRKNIEKMYDLEFKNINQEVVLKCKFGGEQVWFIPRYLNCTNWGNDFNEFKNFLFDMNAASFCVLGDLNARIACEQHIEKRMLANCPCISANRKSKDVKLDANGRKILELFDDIGGIIINGRTDGDKHGNFTFMGSMGNSVIDYCCCSVSFLNVVQNFSVLDKPYSDHMPLNLVISTKSRLVANDEHKLRPKLLWLDRSAYNYTAKLSHLTAHTTLPIGSINDRVDFLKQLIIEAAPVYHERKLYEPKEKWFDAQCYNSRKKMFASLKLWRRCSIPLLRERYLCAVRSYKNLCKEKQIQYTNNNVELLNNARNSKEWWALANSFKSRKWKTNVPIDISVLSSHFFELLSQDATLSIDTVEPRVFHYELDRELVLDELIVALRNTKKGKAPGADRISYEFYAHAPLNFLKWVLVVLNEIFNNGFTPESFRTSIILPLHKKGDRSDASNYRGLSLLDTLYKLFTSILLKRLTAWAERYSILNEYQAGFRQGYSTVDNIFNLSSIAHIYIKSMKKRLYAFFVDLKAAFDTIPRQALFYKLYSIGISSKIINTIRQFYTNTKSAVWNGEHTSEYFEVLHGVRQGCVLSPMLFSLYVNDMHDCLSGGITIGGTVIKLLLYADDIVLLSDRVEGLQVMINELESYCTQWGLTVNLLKSKVMVFRNGTRLSPKEKWYYGGGEIETVNYYKYLGVTLTYNLSLNRHFNETLVKSKNAIASTWSQFVRNRRITQDNKIKIYTSASRSIMCYAAQVWGYNQYDIVERLQRFFLKKLLHLPSNTPNYMIHLETRRDKEYTITLKTHFDYIRKIMKYPRQRLPRILMEEVILKMTYWAESWVQIFDSVGMKLDFFGERVDWVDAHTKVIELLKAKHYNEHISQARMSQFHDQYGVLQHKDTPDYFRGDMGLAAISMIFKARGGLLNINARAFKNNTMGYCTICNLDEAENTYHFIAVCPIYKAIRRRWLRKDELSKAEFLCVMNGSSYASLSKYLIHALHYRNLIVNEFS